jgi:putative iron-only hydrogenase system regulator
MNRRLGFIGIIINNKESAVEKVNKLISQYGEFILSRTGTPYREKDVAVISLVVDINSDTLGSFTGKLGSIESVTVKSALSKIG